MKRKNIFLILGGVFLLIILLVLLKSATINQINAGATVTIDEWGVSKNVTNNHPTLAIMVPAGSSLEWSEFRANALGVTIADPSECSLASQCLSLYPVCPDPLDCQGGNCCCAAGLCKVGCPLPC